MGTGAVVGNALNKWEWHYEPGNGLPENVCFVAGTLVATANGLVAIEKIKAGDLVVSTNPETDETREKEVIETYIRKVNQLTKITVGREDIIATPNHPFYCIDNGWVDIADVKVGYMLRNPNGELVVIERVMHTAFDEPVEVYNLQVEDFHSYYVGSVEVLVHNADYSPRQPRKDVIRVGQNPDGITTYTKEVNGKEVSVPYNEKGYASFLDCPESLHPTYSEPVKIDGMVGDASDFGRANRALKEVFPDYKYSNVRKDYSWHHMEDGQHMLLVRTDIHSVFSHTGGASIVRNLNISIP